MYFLPDFTVFIVEKLRSTKKEILFVSHKNEFYFLFFLTSNNKYISPWHNTLWCCMKSNFVSKQNVLCCTKSNVMSTKAGWCCKKKCFMTTTTTKSWCCAKKVFHVDKNKMLHRKNILRWRKLLIFSGTAARRNFS